MKLEFTDDMKEILNEFLIEAEEILDSLDQDLIELEQNPTDKDLLNKIFRGMHTLKGGAGFLNLESIVELAHKLEDIFNKLRNDELSLDSDKMDVVFEGIDYLKSSIENLKENYEIPDIEEIKPVLTKLEKILSSQEEPPEEPIHSESTEDSLEFVDDLDPELKKLFEKFKGKSLEDILEEIILLPPDERPDMTVIEKLEALIAQGKDISDFIKKKDSNEKSKETHQKQSSSAPSVKQPLPSKDNSNNQKPQKQKTEKKEKKEEVIRVDVDRVETLMNLVGELVLDRNRIVRLAYTNLTNGDRSEEAVEDILEAITGLSRTVSDLQDAVMKLRMQPVKRVFSKFPRIVRDLAKKLNKKVQLELEGEETEIDRSILDKIEEPLIHLVRNAIDHGIETPEERTAKGKPETGTIRLAAYQEGDRIILLIEDDGKGIDVEKVKQKAIEKGLITPEQAENLSDKEAYELILMPGFSTADQVSDVSGRGVGMDVVASTIHSLRGSIEIESELGKGTKILMKLPLTVAIIRTLMVGIKDRIFAIPLFSVVEIVKYDPTSVKQVGQFKSFMLRDEVFLMFTLNELFEVEENPHKQFVIIVRVGEKNIAIAVEELFGEEEIVIKPLGKLLNNTPGVAGATITGDGKVVLIIDTNSLIGNLKNQLIGVA
ncbi:MAG: chemotaxis protein CheA [Aquificae bacterium]|nr:chemotaxis protein CheA [Aquificota bacterium]